MHIYNNNLVGSFLCALILVFIPFSTELFSQNPDDCLIRADIEPDQQEQSFRAVSVAQTDLDLQDWSNLDAGNSTNFDITQVSLEGNQSTEEISFSSFYADIQEGSTIHGVQLRITGSSTHPSFIHEKNIQFHYDGQPIGTSLEGKSNIAVPWKADISDWEYGYEFTDWGINWTTEMLRSEKLSVVIQLENIDDEEFIEAYIDNIELVVHYTELYTLCSHACVVMYNDEVPGASQYIWSVPEGVKFLNNDPEHRVVNLDFSNAADGILDLSLDIVVGSDTLNCTRQVYHTICSDASIGNFVWFDENFDGIQNNEEIGIEGAMVKLMNPYSEEIQMMETNQNGDYMLHDIPKGFYYIKLEKDGFVTAPFKNGVADIDSDLMENFETPVFYIKGGDSIVNMDFGLFDEGSIEGIVWDECLIDGQFNNDDQLLSNIPVQLYMDEELQAESFTDENGVYRFTSLLPGQYTVKVITDDFASSVNSTNNQNATNVFIGNEVTVEITPGLDLVDINAAINPKADVEIEIFFDENGSGEMELNENIFDGHEVKLLLSNLSVVTTSIEDGIIKVDDLDAGIYGIEVNIDTDYSILAHEEFTALTNDEFFLLLDFSLDCRTLNPYQFILGAPSASIGNFIWFDSNADGKQDSDEIGISSVAIDLLDEQGSVINSTVTDENGEYLFEDLDEGTYSLQIKYENENRELTTFDSDPEIGSKGTYDGENVVVGPIQLSAGVNQYNWDVGFRDKYGTISDLVWVDKNRNGLYDADESGLSEVTVSIFTEDDVLVEMTNTDQEGKYSLDVPAGKYYATFSHTEYIDFTEYNIDFDQTINSDVNTETQRTELFDVVGDEVRTDIDAGYLPRTAFIGDFVFLDLNANGVQDDGEVGLKNFMVEAYSEDGVLQGSGITDEDGIYSIEVPEGAYYLKFSKTNFDEVSPSIPADPEKDSNITGQFGFGTTDLFSVVAYEVKNNVDAGFLTVPTLIGDFVWYDYNSNGIQDITEGGVRDIVVNLIKVGTGVVGSETSGNGFDEDKGKYIFSVDQPGEYYLQFILPDNSWSFTDADILDDDLDSDVSFDNGFGTTPIFEIEIGEDLLNMDAGMIGPSSIIGDYVWRDKNNNGLQDDDEEGINGMNVFIYDEFFNFIDVTLTTFNQQSGHDGYYEFPDLEEGNYILVFDGTEEFSTPNVGTNEDIDSDVTSQFVNGSTGIVTITAQSQMFNIDAGVLNPDLGQTGTVGDLVWEDLNKNGIQEATEKGKADVYVELFTQSGETMGSTETDENGFYQFEEVPIGEYKIFVEMPDDFAATIIDNSFDDETDSDIKEDGYSNEFIVGGGANVDHIDVGLIPTNGVISGLVWIDENGDGMIGDEESSLPNVFVALYNDTGEMMESQISNTEGGYEFSNLIVGEYYLAYEFTENYVGSVYSNAGDDQMIDNTFGEGTTSSIDLLMYDGYYAVVTAGVIKNASLAESSITIDGSSNDDLSNFIHWNTSTLELSNYFIIERKTIESDWEEIGTVLNTENPILEYTDYDAKFIKEHVAYRIAQVDLDGTQKVSDQIWLMEESEHYLNVQPNPATSATTLVFELEKEEKVELNLYALDGQLVRSVLTSQILSEGAHQYEINLSSLTTGLYVLKYKTPTEQKTQKLIIK